MISRLLAVSFLATSTLLAQEVTFNKQNPAVGDRRTEEGTMSTDMEIKVAMGGNVLQTVKQSQGEEESFRWTVLAVDGKEVTKAKIECMKKVASGNGPMGEMKEESPLVGQTVIATLEDGEIAITDEEGNKVDGEIAAAAKEEAEGKLGKKKSDFSTLIPDRPVKIGETLELSGDKARELFAQGSEGLEDVKITLTLKEQTKHAGHDCGVFDIAVEMGGEQQGMEIGGKLAGKLYLATATTWPVEMNLEGNMKVSGAQEQGGQKIDIDGSGPMKMTRKASYDKVK